MVIEQSASVRAGDFDPARWPLDPEQAAALPVISELLAVQPTELFRVEIEPGVELGGWMMKPRDFPKDEVTES